MLSHPLREAIRRVVAQDEMSGDELDQVYTELAEKFPFVSRDDLPGSIDAIVSGAVGAGEGAAEALRDFVLKEREKLLQPTPSRRGQSPDAVTLRLSAKPAYAANTAAAAAKEGGKLLALAGLVKPPDPEAVETKIAQVVTLAKANKTRIDLGSEYAVKFIKLRDVAAIGQSMVGLNKGDDTISEVRVVHYSGKKPSAALHAFDKAGFHVLEAQIECKQPGTVYVESLQASHGRNCEELLMAHGGNAVGRGNAALVAAGLEALLVESAKAGMWAIVTRPGSPEVRRLYERMGFSGVQSDDASATYVPKPYKRNLLGWALEKLPVAKGLLDAATLLREGLKQAAGEPAETMVLDLTNADAVRQALSGFMLMRAAVSDVPKGIAEKMRAAGEKPDRPSIKNYVKDFPEDAPNVRVLRPAE